jgi:hypothetical protein
MADAGRGRFTIVPTERLDRLSHDQEDIARLFKRFNFADIRIVTIAEGEIGEMHIGLKGTMNLPQGSRPQDPPGPARQNRSGQIRRRQRLRLSGARFWRRWLGGNSMTLANAPSTVERDAI